MLIKRLSMAAATTVGAAANVAAVSAGEARHEGVACPGCSAAAAA